MVLKSVQIRLQLLEIKNFGLFTANENVILKGLERLYVKCLCNMQFIISMFAPQFYLSTEGYG